jgi:hypothetical protein
MTSGSYSQGRLITEIERDSIFSKITRGSQAIEQNLILKTRIKTKDSVIALQVEVIGIQKTDLGLKDQQITLLNTVIENQKVMITNETKRGRRKGFYGFLKGVGVGALGILLLL